MDYKRACLTLDIDFNIKQLDLLLIRKQYKLLALKYHPDKNKHCKNKFIEIKEAYDFLESYINIDASVREEEEEEEEKEEDKSKDLSEYTQLLYFFLTAYASPVLIHIISNMILDTDSITFKTIESMEKEDLWEIYHFLKKYNKILNLDEHLFEQIRTWINEKYTNDTFYYLNPSLADLLECNCYKLWDNNKYYIVPLWHNEVHFDVENTNNKIIVFCDPEMNDTNISVNEHTEIIAEYRVAFDKHLLENSWISFMLGKKTLNVPLDKILMKPLQYIRIPNQGIPKIDKNDIYNVNKKNDIIIKLIFS
jgi:curved DNA-binding protein CbpA